MFGARSRVGERVVDEDVLGEEVLWIEVNHSSLISTAIMLLDMDGTVVDVDLMLVATSLSRAVCRVCNPCCSDKFSLLNLAVHTGHSCQCQIEQSCQDR